MENNDLFEPFFPNNSNFRQTRKNNVRTPVNISAVNSFGVVVIPASKKFNQIVIRSDLLNVPVQIYSLRNPSVNTSINILSNASNWNTGNSRANILRNLVNADFIVALYDTTNLRNLIQISDGTLIGFTSVSIHRKKLSNNSFVKYLHINKIYLNNAYQNTFTDLSFIKIIQFIALSSKLYKLTIPVIQDKIDFYKQLGFKNNDDVMSLQVMNINYNNKPRTTRKSK